MCFLQVREREEEFWGLGRKVYLGSHWSRSQLPPHFTHVGPLKFFTFLWTSRQWCIPKALDNRGRVRGMWNRFLRNTEVEGDGRMKHSRLVNIVLYRIPSKSFGFSVATLRCSHSSSGDLPEEAAESQMASSPIISCDSGVMTSFAGPQCPHPTNRCNNNGIQLSALE